MSQLIKSVVLSVISVESAVSMWFWFNHRFPGEHGEFTDYLKQIKSVVFICDLHGIRGEYVVLV